MFFWDEDGVRWYQAAAAYSDFHARLAKMIAMGLTPDDTLCDLGCGVGCLSLALAPYVREVTAVDIDAGSAARAGGCPQCAAHTDHTGGFSRPAAGQPVGCCRLLFFWPLDR